VRHRLEQIHIPDPTLQGTDGGRGVIVRFREAPGQTTQQTANAVKSALEQGFPGLRLTSQDTVGAKVSQELLGGAAIALASAIILMLFYILFRLQLQFGLGAAIALIHDIALTIGMLSVTQIEVNTTSIAALLTVIGYSMNEKVITFDRLRENLRKYKTTPLADVINLSENERLSRTLITGTTALLALSGALFFGGSALFGLVATMCFGIVVGTYSSIYVALPVILLWGVKRNEDEATPLKPMSVRP
jgi:preprotein translocase subunit SecF